jgi:tripartite-type tricarboxylate transporter receptor subunit TctC
MKLFRKLIIIFLLVPGVALAWPTKPINIVVPFSPGGLTDQIMRKIGPELEKQFKVPVIISNRPGGNHMVALNAVFAHDYNDHTFVIADGGLAAGGYWINPALVNNFQMISVLGSAPLVFSGGTNANLDLLRQQIQSKKSVTVASTGFDSMQYLWLASLSNTPDMVSVYYKGGSPAMSDLAGGHVDYAIMSLSLTQQFALTGKVVPLLISTNQRHPLFPEIPTYQEFGWQGQPGEYWVGILSPKNINQATVEKFNHALNKIIQSAAVEQLEGTGMIFNLRSGQDAQQFYLSELNRFQQIRHRVAKQN